MATFHVSVVTTAILGDDELQNEEGGNMMDISIPEYMANELSVAS